MRVKNFDDYIKWVDYGSQEGFIEKFENVIQEMEQRMEKEGVDFGGNVDLFITNLQDLNVENKFEDDLENLASKWYTSMYLGTYDKEYGEHSVTPEYIRVEKEVEAKIAKPGENTKVTKKIPFNQRKRELNNALLKNSIEKHWNEWKAVYQKWIKYVKDHRGVLKGKKFGLA